MKALIQKFLKALDARAQQAGAFNAYLEARSA